MSDKASPPTRDQPQSSEFSKWLGGIPGIVAVLTLLLALFFVVLNAGYVSFYESLGIRPEDVGFDRIAILARTAGLIPIAYALGWVIWFAYDSYRDIPIWLWTAVISILVFGGIFYNGWVLCHSLLCGRAVLYCTSQRIAPEFG